MIDESGKLKYECLFVLYKCLFTITRENAVPKKVFSVNQNVLNMRATKWKTLIRSFKLSILVYKIDCGKICFLISAIMFKVDVFAVLPL